ncbi:helix-turn-helix domain-containing protein [Paracoccus saliphilus]|uniref:Helix-turn-helix n=1 Tax=Paracoccus saliphilus TaxID=405559 RepID=A0AA45W5X3_9RHOB|nr:helix-turn-helix transcriptional regulator [Paracoccus saliphilus]WCR01655.1 helix-turn-helix transcriptional regulator [Paracoccus saliphilus]SIS98249.1 Helix-turn-helix [Paracoccus saliphilus]
MNKGWFDRLVLAIEADDRGMRELSRLAGVGPNYVQQMIKNHKEPGADRLARILDVLGKKNALYILTGIKADDDDLAFLAVLQSLRPDVKNQAKALLASMQADGENATQSPSVNQEDSPTEQ